MARSQPLGGRGLCGGGANPQNACLNGGWHPSYYKIYPIIYEEINKVYVIVCYLLYKIYLIVIGYLYKIYVIGCWTKRSAEVLLNACVLHASL